MLGTPVLLLALAATGLAQVVPEGYRRVVITSNVDKKFVVVPKARTAGSTTIVKTNSGKVDQTWYLKGNSSKILLADSTLCLDGGAKTNWKDMGNIYVNECANNTESQNWFVNPDGRIALEPSGQKECVDLQYMKATENNPVGLYNCAGLGNTGAGDKGINWPLVNFTTTTP